MLRLFLAVAFATLLARSSVAADRPNILVLISDDQRADTIAALGNPDIQTPTLDALARRGCSMDSVYCLGANMGAVCTPSRNMLLSGNAYFRWTAGDKPERFAPATESTLPAVFKRAGYHTYHHGKRGNTATLIHKQFDVSRYLNDYQSRWNQNPGGEIVDAAIEHLAGRSDEQDQPWLMWLEFAMPHDPRAASPEALAAYAGRKLQLPGNVQPHHPFDNGSVLGRDEWTALWPRTPEILSDAWHDYYACISSLDTNVGRLIDHLEQTGALKNTIVVYTSDHGLGMGSHGLMGKQNVYEAGYKAPFLIAGPGIDHGRSDAPAYLMDLYPTLLELAGLPEQNIDGESFAAAIAGGDGPHDAVMLAYTDTQRAIRVDNMKLIVYPKAKRIQLFDLAADPLETNDLSGEPQRRSQIESMLEELGSLQKRYGDLLSPASLDFSTGESASFEPPLPIVPPVTSDAEEIATLMADTYALAGGSVDGFAQIQAVRLAPSEGIVAMAVGVDEASQRLTSLRIDVVNAAVPGPDNRRSVLFGSTDCRWMPLLDQIRPQQQISMLGAVDETGVSALQLGLVDEGPIPMYGNAAGESWSELVISTSPATFGVGVTGGESPQAITAIFIAPHAVAAAEPAQPADQTDR